MTPPRSSHRRRFPSLRLLIAGWMASGILVSGLTAQPANAAQWSLEGVHVVPHVASTEMQYRQAPDPSLGARVEVFLRQTSDSDLEIPRTAAVRVRGKTPEELLIADEWAWHDLPSAQPGEPLRLPPGALTVWSWNGKRADWGVGTRAELELPAASAAGVERVVVPLQAPEVWLSAVTFLGTPARPQPESLLFHVMNASTEPLQVEAVRWWLPVSNTTWRALLPHPWRQQDLERFPTDGWIPAGERGGARVETGPLPLTYTALEVRLRDRSGHARSVWAHLRIKREVFDISGGWVASGVGGSNTVHSAAFLRTLHRLHVNTGHLGEVPGYTDQQGPDGLYTRYPLKYFHQLQPFTHYDRDEVLPRIHAVEFLGEPQYGGGRPVPPQEVWSAFAPYAPTRLPTTVTHSEERVWRFYAGLSDYPHYDAYRVSAPAADVWGRYDRWGGARIRWGAPLETIGVMTRSLRELNRPRPIAYWSQGAHDGWDRYGGRARTSPTPDELRMQAYQAIANRITSLYWFNLSVGSLVKFPDLLEPIGRVGREIRMLDDYYLEGDATWHERVTREGRPAWDLNVVAGPRGAVLLALDLWYEADLQERVFRFGAPREERFRFRLPSYLAGIAEVLRVDADSVVPVPFARAAQGVEITDRVSGVAIYVAAARPGEAARIEARRRALVAAEEALGFDPARRPADLEVLRALAAGTRP